MPAPSPGLLPFAVITQGLVTPLGAPLAPQNHSVTDQDSEAVVWVARGRGESQSSLCLLLLTWDFEQVGLWLWFPAALGTSLSLLGPKPSLLIRVCVS